MRTAQFPKGDWARIDKAILKEVKNTLNLPTEVSNEYFIGQKKLVCCGLPIAAEDSYINLIDTAFKLLSSRDEMCYCLSSVYHTQKDLEDCLMIKSFLTSCQGNIGGDFSTTSNKFSTTWTVARVASRGLGVQWVFENSVPSLVFQDLTLKVNSSLLAEHPSLESFGTFEQTVQSFTHEAIQHLFPEETGSWISSSSSSSSSNMADSATCQKLYRRNRRRAVREILGNTGERCKIPLLLLQTYFSECWEAGTSDPQLYSSIGSEGRVELLESEFSKKEVWAILKKAENTAPGPDRLTYHHLRLVDPGDKILTKIFNLCVRYRKIPSI
ncbi:retrovirus-related Pol polyprotein from type-2 retrotransposable element R2DM [Caerostris extrusa]|uniref:Retrovirus-related Pol polyprotein from type-2 retrotransposable element R2DM n=1 Tax=Caerostris extrusa TaxID=172846 RepID=A0AAV4R7A1_CAEEX|nr:retrovirus-related Pol polyprotein from type-2 retrotransposable element R2DM [Caerostris extrusa]